MFSQCQITHVCTQASGAGASWAQPVSWRQVCCQGQRSAHWPSLSPPPGWPSPPTGLQGVGCLWVGKWWLCASACVCWLWTICARYVPVALFWNKEAEEKKIICVYSELWAEQILVSPKGWFSFFVEKIQYVGLGGRDVDWRGFHVELKPHLFCHKHLIWVLYWLMEWTMVWIWFQHSDECDVSHLIAANICCHQWMHTMNFLENFVWSPPVC